MPDQPPARRRVYVAGQRRRRPGAETPAGPPSAEPAEVAAPEPAVAAPDPAPPTAAEPAAEPAGASFLLAAPERPAGPVAGPSRRGRAGAAVLPWALFGAAVLLLALALIFKLWPSGGVPASTRSKIIAASGQATAAVLSYDYRQLPADFARAEALLSPRFLPTYRNLVTNEIGPLASQNKGILTASVVDIGLRNVTGHSAVALVFVDTVSTNAKRSTPQISEERVRLSMVLQHGRWLVDNIAAL